MTTQAAAPTSRATLWVLGACLGALALASLAIAFRPSTVLFAHPFIEDAYYALSVARNLASGNGVTIDGSTATNGFQPLFTFLQAIPFLMSSTDEVAIRLTLGLHWAVFLATAAVLGLIARDFFGRDGSSGRLALFIAPLLFMSSFFALNTAFNGLETGALLLAYAVTWWWYQRRGAETWPSTVVLGLLAGATVLVRIDALFVVAVIVLVVWRSSGFVRAAGVGAVALAVSSPWFIYNFAVFGSFMPTSGSAQTLVEVSSFRLFQIAEALSAVLMPWLPLSRVDSVGAVVVRFAAVAIVVGALWRTRALVGRDAEGRRSLAFAGSLVVGYVLLAGYYSSTSFAVWFYGRYMAPLLLVSVFALTVLVVHTWRRLWVPVLVVLAALGCLASLGHWTDQIYPANEMLVDQVALVEATVPSGETAAAGQTGTLGFFRDGVVNLDGKVNPDVLAFDGDRRRLLDEQGIDWVCDWPSNVDKYLGQGRPGWTEVARQGTFVCVTRS